MPLALPRIHSPLRTLLFALLATAYSLPASSAELNVYSARKEALIKPLLDRFSEQTGTEINLVTGSGDALLTRLQTEGRNSPADVLITTDAGRLVRAEEAGVLQPVESAKLTTAIPAHLRSASGLWFGLSVRTRPLFFAPERVSREELSTYEALADEEWRGRLCIRSSGNIYNQSLVASMIAHRGLANTESWLTAFTGSFARPPQGGDRDQIKAVAAGQCDIAIANSYYYGAMLQSADVNEREAANRVELFWPNQQGRGVHANISGAGLTQSAKNKEEAIALLEFLTTEESQRWYAETNNEYPVRADVPISVTLTSWGEFKADTLDVTKLGKHNASAVMAMDRAGWK